jgi:recombination protein RecR
MAPESLEALLAQLERLPGIGPRTASRLAHHLLRVPEDEALALAEAIQTARARIRPCSMCRAPAETDPCPLCSNAARDHSLLLVVETPRDLTAVEATGAYGGLYFVLGARLSPLEGVDERALGLDGLVARASHPAVREICIGTNPDLEGDGTALALIKVLSERADDLARGAGGASAPVGDDHVAEGDSRPHEVRVTRLARGLPTGGQIEHQNASAIADAFDGRQRAGS